MAANKLSELRKAKRVTQEVAAKALGINHQYLSMLERDVRTPGFRLAKRMADYYGVPIDELFFTNQSNKTFANQ